MIVPRMMMSYQSPNEIVVRTKNIMKKIGFENDQYQIHEVENVADLDPGITEEEKEADQTRGIELEITKAVTRIEDEDMIRAVRATQKTPGLVKSEEVEAGIDGAEAGIDEVEAEKDEIVIDEAVQGQVPAIETGIAMAILQETTEDDTNIQLHYSCCIVY